MNSGLTSKSLLCCHRRRDPTGQSPVSERPLSAFLHEPWSTDQWQLQRTSHQCHHFWPTNMHFTLSREKSHELLQSQKWLAIKKSWAGSFSHGWLECRLSIPLSPFKPLSSFLHITSLHVYSVVSDSATPWTVARQAPLFMGFSRQECCSGLPFPPPGDFLNPEPVSPALAGRFFTTAPPGKLYTPVKQKSIINLLF